MSLIVKEESKEEMEDLTYRSRRDFLLRLPKQAVCAEIGVGWGDFTKDIIEVTSPATLYLIDHWWLCNPEGKWKWEPESRQSAMEGFVHVVNIFKPLLVSQQLCLKIGDDLEMLAALPEKHLDWAYLDTSHTYERTTKELALLRTRVKDGGVIAGHDWQPNPRHRHHGMFRAVNEFIAAAECELLYVDTFTQWCISLAG